MIHNGLLTVKLNYISKFNIFILEELVDNFMQYEDKNLRVYAGNDSDNFLLFAHPQKTDIKDSIINLVTNIKKLMNDVGFTFVFENYACINEKKRFYVNSKIELLIVLNNSGLGRYKVQF